jgi:protein-tyrosine phosphatase
MIDIHAHVLPIDDGAKTFDDSVEMCRQAYKNGIRKIICTPHVVSPGHRVDIDLINYSIKKLNGMLKQERIDIKLIQGAENYIGNSVTINRTKYVLVEFPVSDVPVYAESVIRDVLYKHYVIIAHPEKNLRIQKQPELLENFVKLGCYVQLDADSFVTSGPQNKRALEFVEQRLCHFIASNMHKPADAQNLRMALEIVKNISPHAMDFVTKNPELVIEGIKI